jgi:hypothetical protein
MSLPTTLTTPNSPSKVYSDLIRNVGDELTDNCLKVITAECLSLLQSVRKLETLCLSSYNDATAGAAILAAGEVAAQAQVQPVVAPVSMPSAAPPSTPTMM